MNQVSQARYSNSTFPLGETQNTFAVAKAVPTADHVSQPNPWGCVAAAVSGMAAGLWEDNHCCWGSRPKPQFRSLLTENSAAHRVARCSAYLLTLGYIHFH